MSDPQVEHPTRPIVHAFSVVLAQRAALAQHVVNAVSQFEQLRVAERFDKIDQTPLERVQGLFGQAALKLSLIHISEPTRRS